MEPCRLDHWVDLDDSFDWEATYQRLRFDQWICPKKDQVIYLSGNYVSEIFQFLKISVNKCDNQELKSLYDWDLECASDTEVQAALDSKKGTALISIYQSNNIINPQNQKPNQAYLSEDLFFNFQPARFFSSADIYIQDVKVITDQSLSPRAEYEQQNFHFFDNQDFRETYEGGSATQYGQFFFRRSPISQQYDRSFQKIDDLLSYIGGFLQFVIFTLSFVVGYFNYWIFVVDIANKLYSFKKKEDKSIIQQRQKQVSNLMNQNQVQEEIQQLQFTSKVDIPQLKEKENLEKQNSKIKQPELRAEDIRLIIKSRNQSLKSTDAVQDQKQKILQKHKSVDIEKASIVPIIKSKSQLGFDMNKEKQFKQVYTYNDLSVVQESQKDNNDVSNIISNINLNTAEGQKQQRNQYKQPIKPSLFTPLNVNIDEIEDQPTEQNSLITNNNLQTNEIQLQDKQVAQNQLDNVISNKQIVFEQDNTHLCRQQFELQQKNVENKDELYYGEQKENPKIKGEQNQQIKEETKVNSLFQGFNFRTKKSFLMQQFDSIISKNTRLSISIKFFLNKIFCGCLFKSVDNKLINKAQRLISSDLDVYVIIEKLQEIDKLKKILFDQQQQILFGFVPKMEISVEYNDQKEGFNREYLYQEYKKKAKMISSILSTSNKSKKNKKKKDEKVIENQNSNPLDSNDKIKGEGIIMRRNKFNDIGAYKKLYEAYCSIVEQNPSQYISEINKKLIQFLGSEMADIFQTSKLLSFSNESSQISMDINPKIQDKAPKQIVLIEDQAFTDNLQNNNQEIVNQDCKEDMDLTNYANQKLQENNKQFKNIDWQINKNKSNEKFDNSEVIREIPGENSSNIKIQIQNNTMIKNNLKDL